MLGNALNPASTMAQKMSDSLSAELEAHSVFTACANQSPTLVGAALPSRVIATVRLTYIIYTFNMGLQY
jgi:hypothetical protein